MAENNTNAQQQPNTQPEGNGGSGKTFTQEEVNRIVSDRLAREREKGVQSPSEREQQFNARENLLNCREYISQKGYPSKLLEIFSTADSSEFEKSVEKLLEAFPGIVHKGPVKTGLSHQGGGEGDAAGDRIAKAFKPK